VPTEKRPSKVEGGDATPTRRRAGERSPLLRPDWRYVEPCNMDDYRAEDWAVMNRQRAEYLEEQQAVQVLDMLKASRDAPTFGYLINNYEHCLQTATLLHEDGHDEETVVTGLLHDIGFTVCSEDHGRFAADLLRPHVSERNIWALEHHEMFQRVHLHGYFDVEDPAFINERDRWRDHPHYAWTAEFVARYDITTIDPNVESLPIESFEPMVRRVFSRTHKAQERGGR
jgi:predicted HD phosphohydrolase